MMRMLESIIWVRILRFRLIGQKMGKAHLSYVNTGFTYDSAFSASLVLHFRRLSAVGSRIMMLGDIIHESTKY